MGPPEAAPIQTDPLPEPELPFADDDLTALFADRRETDWLLTHLESTGFAGMFWSRLTGPQRQALPPPVRETLVTAHLGLVARAAGLQHGLGECLVRLKDVGVPVILLKGAALANTVYADAAERPMSDLDLLVPDEALERARGALADLAETLGRDSHDLHLGPLTLPGKWGTIELHGVGGHVRSWPQIAPSDPFDRAVPVTVLGRRTLALDPRDAALHTVCHALGHGLWRWPMMAADLRRLWAHSPEMEGAWPTVLAAAGEAGRHRAMVTAAAFAQGADLPAEVRSLIPEPLALEAERTARLAWRGAFTCQGAVALCWERCWCAESAEQRRREMARFVFPPLRDTVGRFGAGTAGAVLIYPAWAVSRAGRWAAGGLRWGLFLWRHR